MNLRSAGEGTLIRKIREKFARFEGGSVQVGGGVRVPDQSPEIPGDVTGVRVI